MAKMGRPQLRDAVLAAIPGTRAQIAKKASVSSSSVGKWLAILRDEGVIHVGDWKRSKGGGAKQPVFVLGPGEDVKAPKSITPEKSQERYRKRHPERRREIQANSERRRKMRDSGHGWLATLVFL